MNKKLLILAAVLFGAAFLIGGFYFNQINQSGWMMGNMAGQTTSGMMGNSGMMTMMSQQGSGMMDMMHSQNGAGMMGNGQHDSMTGMTGMMTDGNCDMMENLEHHPDAESNPAN